MEEGVTHLFKCAGNIFSTAVLNLTIFPKVVNPSLGKTVSSSLFLRSRIQLWPSMSSAVNKSKRLSLRASDPIYCQYITSITAGLDISARPLAQASVKSVGRVQITDHSPVWRVRFFIAKKLIKLHFFIFCFAEKSLNTNLP